MGSCQSTENIASSETFYSSSQVTGARADALRPKSLASEPFSRCASPTQQSISHATATQTVLVSPRQNRPPLLAQPSLESGAAVQSQSAVSALAQVSGPELEQIVHNRRKSLELQQNKLTMADADGTDSLSFSNAREQDNKSSGLSIWPELGSASASLASGSTSSPTRSANFLSTAGVAVELQASSSPSSAQSSVAATPVHASQTASAQSSAVSTAAVTPAPRSPKPAENGEPVDKFTQFFSKFLSSQASSPISAAQLASSPSKLKSLKSHRESSADGISLKEIPVPLIGREREESSLIVGSAILDVAMSQDDDREDSESQTFSTKFTLERINEGLSNSRPNSSSATSTQRRGFTIILESPTPPAEDQEMMKEDGNEIPLMTCDSDSRSPSVLSGRKRGRKQHILRDGKFHQPSEVTIMEESAAQIQQPKRQNYAASKDQPELPGNLTESDTDSDKEKEKDEESRKSSRIRFVRNGSEVQPQPPAQSNSNSTPATPSRRVFIRGGSTGGPIKMDSLEESGAKPPLRRVQTDSIMTPASSAAQSRSPSAIGGSSVAKRLTEAKEWNKVGKSQSAPAAQRRLLNPLHSNTLNIYNVLHSTSSALPFGFTIAPLTKLQFCYPSPLLAGARGTYSHSPGGPKVCAKLTCTQCSYEVISVDHVEWRSDFTWKQMNTAYPFIGQLKNYLINSPGTRSYCCKCHWTSVKKMVECKQVEIPKGAIKEENNGDEETARASRSRSHSHSHSRSECSGHDHHHPPELDPVQFLGLPWICAGHD